MDNGPPSETPWLKPLVTPLTEGGRNVYDSPRGGTSPCRAPVRTIQPWSEL